MDYKERIKEIIADTLGIDIERITDDLAAGDIEEWDSVGNLTIISTIEEELEVDIPIEDLYELNNIKAIVEECIKRNLDEIKQTILQESSLKRVRLGEGNKIQLVDNKGNLYESTLEFKKNILKK